MDQNWSSVLRTGETWGRQGPVIEITGYDRAPY